MDIEELINNINDYDKIKSKHLEKLANKILKANDLSNSLIQKGIIKETIRSLAVLGFAIFAIQNAIG